jgi:serine/threonine protein kinase
MKAANLVGTTLQETYRLERLVGEGGMGAVYEASHRRLARRFAVKVLYPNVAAVAETMERFRREALVTSGLGHKHILEVIDFNSTSDGMPYIVMELLVGEDLSRRIQRSGPLLLAEALAIVGQVASAMEAAHQAGVVHRDLKPQNIFLCQRDGRDDFVKVVDFGISKVLGATSGLTGTNTLIGTPYYMAPEQAQHKAGAADHRADIYALGVILYEMLSGAPPFTGDSLSAVLYKVVHSPTPLLREERSELP